MLDFTYIVTANSCVDLLTAANNTGKTLPVFGVKMPSRKLVDVFRFVDLGVSSLHIGVRQCS